MPAPDEDHPVDADLPARVERELVDYLDTRRAEAQAADPAFADAVDALRGFVLGGGKRIRPTFAWWGWRAGGGDPGGAEAPAVLRAISALELLQAGALIHDDLIDASAVRRGAPTIHVAFAGRHRQHGWLGQPERFGLGVAVLLGDIALTWADDMLADSGLPAAPLRRCRAPWQRMRTEMLAGQYLDIFTQVTGNESADAALRVDRLKTAAYTVERPLHLGAAIAGADPAAVEALRSFGADIGVAFQLRDDLLGVFGDPEVTGKPAGDDLREGKRTLLVAVALERARERGEHAAAETLRSALGRPDLDEGTVRTVQGLLTDLGAVRAVEDRIAALTEGALGTLRAAPITRTAVAALTQLAVTATERTS
ncbi:polyprenyl synthetase family protein [Gandjariella thermophila]|uniref:polyprenyl synthetase family protein n=1 Tax=Gandjariella thermophila TaxID=1931992 RepID=UPI0010F66759|nr:polyprenyl synthetase family protein [Gandjariella thermophila]